MHMLWHHNHSSAGAEWLSGGKSRDSANIRSTISARRPGPRLTIKLLAAAIPRAQQIPLTGTYLEVMLYQDIQGHAHLVVEGQLSAEIVINVLYLSCVLASYDKALIPGSLHNKQAYKTGL